MKIFSIKNEIDKKAEQGFTLIELLVVIAIIGILAAMVISNLRTARLKARDASAITSMSSARAEAENYYDENYLSYDNMCPGATYAPNVAANTTFETLMVGAANANGATATCAAQDQTYHAYIDLTNTGNAQGDIFCVDSAGFAGRVQNVPTGAECQ
jgi:type IV pilus assembly protein PilA